MSAKTPGYSATPHLLGPGPLWHKPGFKLPNYIENVAKGLMESGHDRTTAIQIAIGTIRRWAAGGGKVHPEVRAAAAKAIAEWEALKSRAHATAHTQEDAVPLALAAPFNPALHPRAPKGAGNGGQFGPARGQAAAAAQKDPKAAANYGKAVGATDAKAQIAGMSNDDLIALARAAYSFKSADPKVVALRIVIANEIARRGGNVNDYGGLGKATPGGPKPLTGGPTTPASAAGKTARKVGGTSQSRSAAAKKAAATRKANKAKPAAVKAAHGLALASPMVTSGDGAAITINAGQRRAWAKTGVAMPSGAFPIPDRRHLAKAIRAVGRAKPADRPAVRAHIRKRAKALGVPVPDGAKKGT